jgi:EAL domain-containing protein (putative c-di-GMP-specific phosphodiesterase class I)
LHEPLSTREANAARRLAVRRGDVGEPAHGLAGFRQQSDCIRDQSQHEPSTGSQNELANALAGDQFILHFQPHLDLVTMRVTGAEALIGWNHPVRGLVFADEFIPFSEHNELIDRIGSWLLRESIAAARILREVDPAFRLYFNLSVTQLEDDRFVKRIIDAANVGAPLDNMGIAITEASAMRDTHRTRRILSVIREHGMHVAIDAFGVGSWARSLVRAFAPNIVKIDRSFIDALPHDRQGTAIVEAIASIGKKLGFFLLAEDVEHTEKLPWLIDNGCRYAQGRALCPPLPLDIFLIWLCAGSIVQSCRTEPIPEA